MTSIVHSGYTSASNVPNWDPKPPPISAEDKKKLDDELDKYMGRGRQGRFRKSRRHNKSRRVSNRRRRNKSRKTKRIR